MLQIDGWLLKGTMSTFWQNLDPVPGDSLSIFSQNVKF